MKVGDRVVIVATDYKGVEGEVVRAYNSGAFQVLLDCPTERLSLPFTARELELIEGE